MFRARREPRSSPTPTTSPTSSGTQQASATLPPLDATAPIPLDLSDWGDATPHERDGQPGEGQTGAGATDEATDAQARRNAASS